MLRNENGPWVQGVNPITANDAALHSLAIKQWPTQLLTSSACNGDLPVDVSLQQMSLAEGQRGEPAASSSNGRQGQSVVEEPHAEKFGRGSDGFKREDGCEKGGDREEADPKTGMGSGGVPGCGSIAEVPGSRMHAQPLPVLRLPPAGDDSGVLTVRNAAHSLFSCVGKDCICYHEERDIPQAWSAYNTLFHLRLSVCYGARWTTCCTAMAFSWWVQML